MELKSSILNTLEEQSLAEKALEILLVEDNPGDALLIEQYLITTGLNFSLNQVSTLRETLLLCSYRVFDVILLDLGLPDSLGLETLKKIQIFNMKSPVIVLTGLDDDDIALESIKTGAQDFLVKNRMTPDVILAGIKYGIERKKIQELHKKNAKQFAILSSTTALINAASDISSIYEITCESISTLLEKTGIVAMELTDPARYYYSGLEYIELWSAEFNIITGLNLNNKELQTPDQDKEILELFKNDKLQTVGRKGNKKRNNLDHGKNKDNSDDFTSLNIYAIGFNSNNLPHGGLFILTQEPIEANDSNIIETICTQVSLCLDRKTIEKNLKASENRYRTLSRELDTKVKSRTKDLESINNQLNKELIERQLIETALRKSEDRLTELNATKDKFFNIIAHDLKNPFTCLLGSTEILNSYIQKMDIDKIQKLVQILNETTKSGYAILQNLLDWSRSQTGLIVFNPERKNLKIIIDEQISNLKLTSTKKGINLFSELQEDLWIYLDINMINTILRNLLANAVKFTPRSGTISINAIVKDYEVIINIKDSGIGIPEEKISELFRLDTKYTRPGTDLETGTGLGLKLCKEFVTMHGGKIWVESEIGNGSNFMFSIPLKTG